jgi:hypothetical protein
MSIVEANSMAPEIARAITDRIKIAIDATWQLIAEAYQGRAWSALGYSSWDDYCTREFGASRLRLPREERQDVVASLRDAGLSIRAIASATWSSVNTVMGDLSQTETPDDDDPDPSPLAPVVGIDGKRYPQPTPRPRPIETIEQREEREHREAIERCVARLEKFCNGMVEFVALRDNPDREEILAGLVESDRLIVLDYERRIRWVA